MQIELNTIIIFCYRTLFENDDIKILHDKTYEHYINFFNDSMCKILSIDASEKTYKNIKTLKFQQFP